MLCWLPVATHANLGTMMSHTVVIYTGAERLAPARFHDLAHSRVRVMDVVTRDATMAPTYR